MTSQKFQDRKIYLKTLDKNKGGGIIDVDIDDDDHCLQIFIEKWFYPTIKKMASTIVLGQFPAPVSDRPQPDHIFKKFLSIWRLATSFVRPKSLIIKPRSFEFDN